MLLIFCPRHASRVMVPTSRIRDLRNTEAGILLLVECWCGERVRLRTGRHAQPYRLAA